MKKRERHSLREHTIAVVIVAGIILHSAIARADDKAFQYDDYASILNTYVDEDGLVDYKTLKVDRKMLDAFNEELARLAPNVYAGWTEKEKIAFWINAYNALTLQAIIDHYPIKPSFMGALLYPKNSIRQISGVWDKLKFPVMGRMMTLNDIEHDILRKEFNEPRIHLALVCASMGCPALRAEPFKGDTLDAQLGDQTRRFLKNPSKFRIDPLDERVYLSSIFNWFGEDFVKSYGTKNEFTGHGETTRAVWNFISKYSSEEVSTYLATGNYSLEYLDYDWSLNEQNEK